jgi:hypothetical protein
MIRGQDIIDATRGGNLELEEPFSKIKTWHMRVAEKCHMVNKGDWLESNSEDARDAVSYILLNSSALRNFRGICVPTAA